MADDNDSNVVPEPQVSPPEPSASPDQPDQTVYTWGMVCHLAALAQLIGIPFGTVLGPLVVWLIKKDEHPFIDAQGKAALNFQISVLIYSIVGFLLIFVLIGIPILIALGIFDLIMVIVASVKASKGESPKYPLSIQFIK